MPSPLRAVRACLLSLAVGAMAIAGNAVQPDSARAAATGPSGLPLPRFVSLKSSRVNMRVGPGRQYQVEWLYKKRGLPMEVIQEFDNWRKVRDFEGSEGWILQSLLSGDRTALAAPWKEADRDGFVDLYSAPTDISAAKARLEPKVLIEVDECARGWCRISAAGFSGFARQAELWGVYPDETFD